MSYSQIIHLKEISSTNSYLKELVLSSKKKELWTVFTDYQTAGKGQKGNSWESERGQNLMFSTVLYPSFLKANEQFRISELISLTIKGVLDNYVDNISIKWPNDIYWKEKKIAGILIENMIQGENIMYSIIGVGLNLNQETFYSNAPNPISLHQITDDLYDTEQILSLIMAKFNLLLKHINEIGEIHNLYMKSLFRGGGYHSFRDNNECFQAKI